MSSSFDGAGEGRPLRAPRASTDDDIVSAYDLVAENYASLVSDLSFESPLELAMIGEFARRVGGAVAPRRADALDAGCGAGRLIPHLESLGCRVVGADASQGMIREARSRLPKTRFEIAALDAMPFEDGAFDGLVAWYSIIHTPPDELPGVFVEFARLVRPGGFVLLGFQTGEGSRLLERAYGHRLGIEAHLHDVRVTASLLNSAGFSLEAMLDRAPVRAERHGQGSLLARRR